MCIQSTDAVELFKAFEKDDFNAMMAVLGEYQAHPDLRVVHPNPDKRLADGPFVIHVAAFYKAVSCFRYLIHNCTTEKHDNRGRELCQFAAYSGSVTLFEIMLEHEVTIDALGVNFMRPFLIAAKYGHTDLCKWLFVNGCRYECFNKSTQNALDLAGDGLHVETYKFLLRLGLQHETPNSFNGNVWYKSLVKPGNEEFLQMLIESEVPHFADSVGAWPIHYAASVGRVDILQKFLESGADVNVTDNEGETPLMVAVKSGNTESVLFFINAKANVNAQSKSGQTALMIAVETRASDIVSMLIDAEADVNVHDKKGSTALMIAVETRASDIVSMLIDAEADVNVHDKKGSTALIIAVEKRMLNSLGPLLDAGAEVDAIDNNGRTAFHYAAKHGDITGAEVLLDYGADMFARDLAGMGAAGFAQQMRKHKFTKWLLDVERTNQFECSE